MRAIRSGQVGTAFLLALGIAGPAGAESLSCDTGTTTAQLAPPGAVARLRAEASIAMAITGDILFATDRITFANGETMEIEPVACDVWRAKTQPSGPLLEGNTLCGGPVTYLTLHLDSYGAYILNGYGGEAEPVAPAPEAMVGDDSCAAYVYVLEGMQ